VTPRVLACLLVFAALLAPSLASALPWWVEDPDDVEQLSALLDALWPGHPVEVQVGEADFGKEGVSFDGGELVLVSGDRVRFSRSNGDLATQVALVRSWLRETAVPDRGWVPTDPTTLRPGPFVTVLVGGGARLPSTATTAAGDFVLGPASPTAWLVAGAGWSWKHARIGGQAGLTFGERAGLGSQAVTLTRFRAAATASVVAHAGQLQLENTVAVGVRVASIRAVEGDAKEVVRALPGLSVAVRLWGPIGDNVWFGGGLGAGFDTAAVAIQVGPDEIPILLSPVTVTADIGVLFGGPRQRPLTPSRKFL
jgi:hypothetical protein